MYLRRVVLLSRSVTHASTTFTEYEYESLQPCVTYFSISTSSALICAHTPLC